MNTNTHSTKQENSKTAYNPSEVEAEIYKRWEVSGFFNPDNVPSAPSAKPFIIYMPLPNVTGSLHMGHALNNSLQDIMVRYFRMRGRKALYLPGTDHAGIATQYVVEKDLKRQGISRFELGREKFIERVWEWREKYGGLIYEQLKKLGVSADWSRARFTMDPAYGADVVNAFIHYYDRGFLYRGFRTVNWCPRCGTSLSDLELEYEEETATLYYIQYGPFVLATVRPETKFGDTALAVHPKDIRYKDYIGKTLEVDSLDTEGSLDTPRLKKIKLLIVGDEAVDPTFGTGVVKVTPAHDLTDFEIAERHKLPLIQVIDERGKMNERAGKYAGMKTQDARKKILEDLRTTKLLVKEKPYVHRVAKCYRCGSAIEPLPSLQWFLKMKELAKLATKAVTSKKVSINPKRFEKTYLEWLKNIKDWTISRQIWWGHRLPVWFCKTLAGLPINEIKIDDKKSVGNLIPIRDKFIVAIKKPTTCPFCKSCDMEQSNDVLDTWFSSALWPFAGLRESDLKKYYPGNMLITARDILNLWVARMIFSGLEFKGKVPFSDVLIHGTILTKEGRRMSKSLGTGVDPLKYIDSYGADATRFGIVWQATGQDIKWDEAAIMAGKKFANKIWNASRFVIHNAADVPHIELTKMPRAHTPADKKILASLKTTKKNLEKNIETFEFSKALHDLYDFFWHDFCDTYVEVSKKQLQDKNTHDATQHILLYVLFESLKMLHLFMPFVTEKIYSGFPGKPRELLLITPW